MDQKNQGEAGKGHRGVQGAESQATPELRTATLFSPAPWRAQERLSGSENHKGWLIFCSLKGVVGEVYPLNSDPTPTARANARLIAAAPALCKAGQKVLADLNARIRAASDADNPVPVFDGIADLHDALSRATGNVPE